MTIEFHCPQCGKLLKTADDKVGVQARCPGCSEVVTVPAQSEEVREYDASFITNPPSEGAPEVDGVRASADLPETTKPCPVCARQIPESSTRCQFCGEALTPDELAPPADTSGLFVTSDVLARAWTIFQSKIGLLIASTVVFYAILGVLLVPMIIVFVVLMIMSDGRRGPLDSEAGVFVVVGAFVVLTPLYFILASYLQAGYQQLLLDVAQGKPSGIGRLFSGGQFLLRLLGANLLFGLAQLFGMIFLVVPGVFLAVAFWPYSLVIVDQNCGVIEAFRRSWDLMRKNLLASFVLGLALLGIYLASSLIPCVQYIAMIVIQPFLWLCLTVAYVIMTCRHTADRIPRV